jgi:carboxylesterase type B
MVLRAVNCTSLECLRSVPEDAIMKANDRLIVQEESTSGGGTLGPLIGFGPAPDGKDIPDIPLALLDEGLFHQGLGSLLIGSMENEGLGFSHDEGMPGYFPTLVRQIMPNANNETVAALLSNYHPLEPAQLAWDWTTDVIWACNSYNMANGMPEKSKRYIMSQPPAVHGQDLLRESHSHERVDERYQQAAKAGQIIFTTTTRQHLWLPPLLLDNFRPDYCNLFMERRQIGPTMARIKISSISRIPHLNRRICRKS